MMRWQASLALSAFVAIAGGVQAGPPVFHFGVNFGPPIYYHRPWYPVVAVPYYRPYAVYVEPPPVIVHPAPVVVRPAAAVCETPPPPSSVAPAVNYSSASSPRGSADVFLQQLSHPDENARREAALELGRLKAVQAVDPLTATLAGDASPQVRESAARALALIGSPRALTALSNSARVDSSSEVRNSAQFAVEIIHSNLRR